MTKPIANQIINRSHVSPGKNTIINTQDKIPKMGTNGTNGVLNARGRLGCLTRNTQTPTHTSTKASKVPILVISPTTRAGTNAAKRLTKSMNNKFDFEGVPNFGCTCENIFGKRPSFDIEKNTLDWPISITIITDE